MWAFVALVAEVLTLKALDLSPVGLLAWLVAFPRDVPVAVAVVALDVIARALQLGAVPPEMALLVAVVALDVVLSRALFLPASRFLVAVVGLVSLLSACVALEAPHLLGLLAVVADVPFFLAVVASDHYF